MHIPVSHFLETLALGLGAMLVLSLIPATRRFYRVLLWGFVAPLGTWAFLHWLGAPARPAQLAVLLFFAGAFAWAFRRGADLRPGCLGMIFLTIAWAGAVDYLPRLDYSLDQPPPPVLHRNPNGLIPWAPLTCQGVCVGQSEKEVEAHLGAGEVLALRPLFRLWRQKRYGSLVVFYGLKGTAEAVEGDSLEQQGKPLVRAGDTRLHVQTILPDESTEWCRQFREQVSNYTFLWDQDRLSRCRLGALVNPYVKGRPDPFEFAAFEPQSYALQRVTLESRRTEVEKKLGPGRVVPTGSLDPSFEARAYPGLIVLYEQGAVVALAGPSLQKDDKPWDGSAKLESSRVAEVDAYPPGSKVSFYILCLPDLSLGPYQKPQKSRLHQWIEDLGKERTSW